MYNGLIKGRHAKIIETILATIAIFIKALLGIASVKELLDECSVEIELSMYSLFESIELELSLDELHVVVSLMMVPVRGS